MCLKDKLTSRKFWLSVASFIGSIGTTIAGLSSNNEKLAMVGVVCATLSTGIYSICEALVDKEGIDKDL